MNLYVNCGSVDVFRTMSRVLSRLRLHFQRCEQGFRYKCVGGRVCPKTSDARSRRGKGRSKWKARDSLIVRYLANTPISSCVTFMIRHAERKVYSGVSRANHGVVRTMRKSGSPRTHEDINILSPAYLWC
jgi:hypothetical protein